MSLPPVILASASPRRKELLEHLGIKFTVVPSHTEEADTEMLTAFEIAQLNAYRKARATAKHHPDALVIGVDTVVALGTRLFAKPASMTDAERMIGELAGKSHDVVSGVCLLHLRKHRQVLFADRTEVTFRPLNRTQIRRYLSLIKPLDKAAPTPSRPRRTDRGTRGRLIDECGGNALGPVGRGVGAVPELSPCARGGDEFRGGPVVQNQRFASR